MSVGGEIIGVTFKGELAHVVTAERIKGRLRSNDATAVWVKHAGQPISVGDMLWWQGWRAMYTPQRNRVSDQEATRLGLRQGRDWDIVLERVSYSHEAPCFPEPQP